MNKKYVVVFGALVILVIVVIFLIFTLGKNNLNNSSKEIVEYSDENMVLNLKKNTLTKEFSLDYKMYLLEDEVYVDSPGGKRDTTEYLVSMGC